MFYGSKFGFLHRMVVALTLIVAHNQTVYRIGTMEVIDDGLNDYVFISVIAHDGLLIKESLMDFLCGPPG